MNKTILELEGDLLLIKPFSPDDEYRKSAGGIYVGTSNHEKRVRQVVVAVGPDVDDVVNGEEVCVGKHAGIAVDVGGEELKVIERKEILGRFKQVEV